MLACATIVGHHFTRRHACSHGVSDIHPFFKKKPTSPASFHTERSAFVRVIFMSPQIKIQLPSLESAAIQSTSSVSGLNLSRK